MYGGELIHRTADDYGPIEIVDFQQKIRSLHFGNKTQQSASLLNNPFLLIHKYAQAMMLPLSWLKAERVLILGLGSGSMVKYLYNYFQSIQIDAIELRSRIIELATEYFLLPEPDARLNIINQSAFDWLQQAPTDRKYDLICVDMFLTSPSGKDISVDISSVVLKLRQLLSDSGVAVFNHLGDSIYSYSACLPLAHIFPRQLYTIDIESTNTLLLACKSAPPGQIPDPVFYRLESEYSLPFKQYFSKLRPLPTDK